MVLRTWHIESAVVALFLCSIVVLCWAVYFCRHGAWAALSGVVLFVGYAQWRNWYGRRTRARS